MYLGNSFNLGAASQGTEMYTGRHRDCTMLLGVGHIPLGDRARDKPEYNDSWGTERESVDKYSKYYD